MPTKVNHLRALSQVCRQFDGQLAVVTQQEFDTLFEDQGRRALDTDEGLCEAPFTDAHGLWWRRKIIYAVQGREEVGPLIHEMGHVFASPHHPYHDCSTCHEWNWFGWEIILARQIGAYRSWSRQNVNYQTTEGGTTWGSLSTDQRRAVITERLTCAQRSGLIDENRALRSVR